MNANEPQNPDQSETTPIHGVADNPAAGTPGQPADAEQQQRGTKRPLLIGACAAVAALLIGGGGVALGAALADEERDEARPFGSAASERDALEDRDGDGDLSGPSAGVDGTRQGDTGSSPAAALAAADAQSLADAIDAAVGEVSGQGATSIEVERGGWDVDVRLADGTEAEVRVTVGGTVTVHETDREHDGDPLLETSKIPSIIVAALAAAGGGTVESIATDDDRARYDVSVDLGDGRDADVELDEALGVIEVD